MNLLLLPGASKRNKVWITDVEKTLAPYFDETHVRNYSHWDTEDSEINLAKEVNRISQEVIDFEPYCVFAKSAGIMVTCKAIASGVLNPEACLFTGFPLAMVIDHGLPANDWLIATDFPITILQNDSDPLGSYDDVRAYFEHLGRQNVSIHSLPGNTHDYVDFAVLNTFAVQLSNG